MTDMNYDNKF